MEPGINELLAEAQIESQRLPDEIDSLVKQFEQQFNKANELLPHLASQPDLNERYTEVIGDMGLTARTLRMKMDLRHHYQDVIDRLTERML